MRTPRLPDFHLAKRQLAPLLLALGCTNEPPRRDCFARIWVERSAGPTEIVGSWDGFDAGILPEPYDDRWLLARLDLPAGEYAYMLRRGDTDTHVDPHSSVTTFVDDREMSALVVEDCAAPRLRVEQISAVGDRISMLGSFLAAASGAPLDPSTVRASTSDGMPLEVSLADAESGKVALFLNVPADGKYTLRLSASDDNGATATERASVWVGEGERSWHDTVLYQVLVDRFRGPGGKALGAIASPGDRAGGTIDGLRSVVKSGTLQALGVNALWVLPLYANPVARELGLRGHLYEGYHGYWPVAQRKIDARLGGEDDLERLVVTAHQNAMRVVLDVVPNHVHKDSALYREHVDEHWFSPPGCVCGTPTCPWSENIEHCWFTPYLPDIRLEDPDAMRATVENSMWWLERFDLDGLRIDAVPMMPRAFTRRMAHAMSRFSHPRKNVLLLGEVFTGRGERAIESLGYYLGPHGLDSVFDFPLMWALHDVIAKGTDAFSTVEQVLSAEEKLFSGMNVVLARMLNNHDTVRFISVANGDAFGDPWTHPAILPQAREPYRRMALGLAFIFSLPGMPVLYYGDEVGLAGGGDPDNRRVMPSDADLNAEQRNLRQVVQKLGRLRACSQALRSHARQALLIERRHYVLARGKNDNTLALFSTDEQASTILLARSQLTRHYVDAFSGERFAPGHAVPMAPISFRLLLSEGDPCLDGLSAEADQ